MPHSTSFEVGTVCPDGGRIDLNILVMSDKSGAVEIRFSGPGDRPEDRASLLMTADEYEALRSLILRVERKKEALVMRDKMRAWIHSSNQKEACRREALRLSKLPELVVSGDGSGDGAATIAA